VRDNSGAISRTASNTKLRSAWPSPRRDGVPTAIITPSASATPTALPAKASRPWRTLASTSSARPGSKIGISPRSSAAIRAGSLSMQVT